MRTTTLLQDDPFQLVDFKASELITREAAEKFETGQLPDLTLICLQLFQSLIETRGPKSALNFVPLLSGLHLSTDQIESIRSHADTKHVLIDNEWMKAVLIHWTPGTLSSIHGHPTGGCVFKVFDGMLDELRYTCDDQPQLLSSSWMSAGAIGYIDDRLGYHAVGNSSDRSAVSLHVYAKGDTH